MNLESGVSIHDNGVGIPPPQRPKVRFYSAQGHGMVTPLVEDCDVVSSNVSTLTLQLVSSWKHPDKSLRLFPGR